MLDPKKTNKTKFQGQDLLFKFLATCFSDNLKIPVFTSHVTFFRQEQEKLLHCSVFPTKTKTKKRACLPNILNVFLLRFSDKKKKNYYIVMFFRQKKDKPLHCYDFSWDHEATERWMDILGNRVEKGQTKKNIQIEKGKLARDT